MPDDCSPGATTAHAGIEGSGLDIPISYQIWKDKYRYRDEPNIQATWRRVANAVAAAEKADLQEVWAQKFHEILDGFRFIPSSPILTGAGTEWKVTLFACYVMGAVEDSMDGIFRAVREAALTMQAGGGIGIDFSTLRPNGALVRGIGAEASGPVSFMDIWDAMCRTVMSAGRRRGAMMGVLRCDHPDIEAFIEAKADPARLRNFNLSVLVTNAFMQAVKADEDWPLVFGGEVFRTVSARGLWQKITRSNYEYAEPGILFIDRINQGNALFYCESIQATNPCGEVPLPPYGACLLGSINLAAFVVNPFTANAFLDQSALQRTTRTAVRFLDNVIDISNFPLPQQKAEAESKRRIGLGFTGLGDALAMCRSQYGTEEGRRRATLWMRWITEAAIDTSVSLGGEKGSFPLYDPEKYRFPFRLRRPILQEDGTPVTGNWLRNSHLTSIAPTGTISLLAGNVSSGIEPIFDLAYDRKILQPGGSVRIERVEDYAYAKWRQSGTDNPGSFVTARELSPRDHLAMQAAIQPWVDASISKTINCPPDIPFEDFHDIYGSAHELGLKGCTVFRPNAVTGAVLEASVPGPAAGKQEAASASLDGGDDALFEVTDAGREAAGLVLKPREPILNGSTYKLKWPGSEHAIYATLNDTSDGDRRRPFEIFINSKNLEHYAWTVALTRMISAIFRRGGDVSFVVEELKAVFDPRGGAWMNGKYVPSLLAAIGDIIEEHCQACGMWEANGPAPEPTGSHMVPVNDPVPSAQALCPRCHQAAVVAQAGCKNCRSCGWSSCA